MVRTARPAPTLPDVGSTARARYEVAVDGPLAGAVAELIRSRFDGVRIGAGRVSVDGLDQAGVRALLVLLWDTGHDVRSLTRHPG